MDSKPGHGYQAPTPQDSRSPCPALNAAANHGYLPHSGKNIGFIQLVRVLHDLYDLTYPLAITLTLGGFLLCSKNFSLDLHYLAQHNRIEHDASIVHRDVRDGDNLNVYPPLVNEFLAESRNGTGLTLADVARARARREGTLPAGKLDSFHEGIAAGEAALAWMVMGDRKEVKLDIVKTWFGDEKLPKGWVPHAPMTLLQLARAKSQCSEMIDKVKRGEKID